MYLWLSKNKVYFNNPTDKRIEKDSYESWRIVTRRTIQDTLNFDYSYL